MKVNELAKKKGYTSKIQAEVKGYLGDNAGETFLWVHLVCRELQNIPRRNTESALRKYPAGLDSIYKQMIEQVRKANIVEDVQLCLQILSTVMLAFRPLHLSELAATAGIPEDAWEDIRELVEKCGSFLSIQEETVYFIH